MPLKVYLASRYSTKPQIEKYAAELRELGIEVTSTWLEETHAPNSGMGDVSEKLLTQYGYKDLNDIDRAHILVFFAVDPTIPTLRGGRHVEFGYALRDAIEGRKLILVVGPKENIFHTLAEIKHVDTWQEAVHFLLRKKQARNY